MYDGSHLSLETNIRYNDASISTQTAEHQICLVIILPRSFEKIYFKPSFTQNCRPHSTEDASSSGPRLLSNQSRLTGVSSRGEMMDMEALVSSMPESMHHSKKASPA